MKQYKILCETITASNGKRLKNGDTATSEHFNDETAKLLIEAKLIEEIKSEKPPREK